MEEIIARSGLPEHTARYLAHVCRAQHWKESDVESLVELATTSSSIKSPAAFVRHRITHDIKDESPPKPKTFGETLRELACSSCHTYPCTCSWDPEQETWADYRRGVTVQLEVGMV